MMYLPQTLPQTPSSEGESTLFEKMLQRYDHTETQEENKRCALFSNLHPWEIQ